MNELLDLILAPLQRELSGQLRQRLEHVLYDPEEDDRFYLFREALNDFPDEVSPSGWWLDPASCRWWLCLHVDWKAYDEVAWQVQAISRTLGLDTGFASATEAQWDAYFEALKDLQAGRPKSRTPEAQRADDTAGPTVRRRLRAGLDSLGRAMRRASPAELLRPIQPPSPNAPTLDVLSDGADWLRERGYDLLFLDTGGDEYLAVPVRLGLLEQARAAAGRLNVPTFLT